MTFGGEDTRDAMRFVRVTCPYCGERIGLLIDLSAGGQQYIEDCQVCCRPMNLHVGIDADGAPTVDARHEDE